MNQSMKKQQGLVMVFALLVLMSLTILGVASVSSSLMQNKMAQSMEKSALAFDAAEAAIAGVMFESQDSQLLTDVDPTTFDPLSEARQGNIIDLVNEEVSCYENAQWTNRQITSNGLTSGTEHKGTGNYDNNPPITSWSRTAFVKEQACIGSSNVIGGSNISCHVFIVKGCGQLQGSSYAVANSVNASVFAPATN